MARKKRCFYIISYCNRFDYSHGNCKEFPDKEYYNLFRNAKKLPNIYLIGYTAFENYYVNIIKNINIGNNIIKPYGCCYGELIPKIELNDIIFIPPY